MAPQIMVVDDEANVRELVCDALRIAEFETLQANDGMSALTLLRTAKPDLLIIDINMPLMDGFDLVERLRSQNDLTPVLMLSARNDRAEAILRRTSKVSSVSASLSCGPITLNEETHQVTFNEDLVDLSPTEFRLLAILLENKGRVLSKSVLLDDVWGITFDSETSVVDTYISYLRKKLHRDGFEGIKTIRGVGFQILEPK